MCYPSPGPRCSYHAHKEYVEALQKYERSVDAAEKLLLGSKLNEKLEVYESTPRGQNELRRNADAATGADREKLLHKLQSAKSLREKQLKDYESVSARTNITLQDEVETRGVKLNRYSGGCSVALMGLATHAPEIEFHIKNQDTLSSSVGKILVLPEKYQQKWTQLVKNSTGFKHVDKKLEYVLNNSLVLSELSESNQKIVWDWVLRKLKAESYIGFASVNRKTQDLIVSTLEKMNNVYEVSLKLKKRLGGTSSYMGPLETLKSSLKDGPFSEAKIVQNTKLGKTILYNVPPQPREACFISEQIFLSWHKGLKETDGYYEVRKRHQSENYDLHVCFKAKKTITLTAIDSSLTKKFNKAEESL